MTVTKINGFRAPYRSLTLRNEVDAIIQKNGLLSIDQDIYIYSGNVIVPPFTAVIDGLIVQKSTSTTIPFPTGIGLPFYVTVSSATPANVDNLTFQFASSPYDVSSNEAILAEYDGVEFRQLPLVSISGIIQDIQSNSVALGETGPQWGLTTTVSSGNYVNAAGVIIDPVGRTVRMDDDYVTPIIESDPAWDRVDRIVYRLPLDEDNRIGTRKLLIGNTFSTGSQTLFETTVASSSIQRSKVKSVVDSLNHLHTLYTEGFGETFQVYYAKYDSSRSTQLVVPTFVVNASSGFFDVVVDNNNYLHLIYIDGLHVKHLKLNSSGGIYSGPYTLDSGSVQCDFPVVKTDPLYSKLYVVYSSEYTPGVRQLYFTTRTTTGSLVTSNKKITSTSTDLINPSIDVTSDFRVYVAYEDATNETIYYLILDDIGTQISAPTIVSNNTSSTSYGTLVNQAKNPVIGISDNKTLFICFLQKKTISAYGLTIYQSGSAFMPNYINPLESFVAFDMVVDSFMNELHILAGQAARLDYIKVDVLTTVFTIQLNSVGVYAVQLLKDLWGSLVHTWSLPQPGTFTNIGTPQSLQYVGPAAVAGGLNTLILNSYEASFDTATLTHIPLVGERMQVSGSVGNDGTYMITDTRLESINLINDTLVITVGTAFPATELPSTGLAQFAQPDGNSVKFVKSVSEVTKTRALRLDVLPSDILLTRCLFPGPMLLNYFSGNNPILDSDIYGMYGNIDIDWGASNIGALTMTSGAHILNLITYFNYTITGGVFPMTDGDALYVILDGVTSTIIPQVTPVVSLPWGLPIQVLGFVENNEFNPHLFSIAGMHELEVGESIILGQDLSKTLRTRLGITSDISYEAYSSNTFIAPADSYPTAISKLDNALNVISSSHAVEETIYAAAGGQTIFTTTNPELIFSSDNSFPDIQVFVNDRRVHLDQLGGSTLDYIKTDVDTIQFSYTIPEGIPVTIRLERTGGAVSGGGSVDLTNITVDPQPLTNGSQAIGTVTKAWSGVFIKDKLTSQVYELIVTSGVFSVEPRP